MITPSFTYVCKIQEPIQVKNSYKLEMTTGVQNFLGDLGLLQYYDMFVIKGFDSEDDLTHLDAKDLDSMYITDPDHRRQILNAAGCYQISDQYKLFEWLKQNGLDHYFPGFIEGEYTSLEDVERLNLPDEDVYDELEITLPGHKRRFERAVNRLRKRHRPILPAKTEVPVAFGRWGKPKCLGDAKFDFLVIDATIISPREPSKFHTFEFMLDSGSDVVTIREEILQTLDLELLGTIHSKGVHGSKRTNLYKATLRIGSQEMEIEVMGESYDSLGSRVVRHFRHYIDGSRHIWLKGNYKDSDTNIREANLDLKALPPITMETSNYDKNNSFLPISKAPVTSSSSECLKKPKAIPAKSVLSDPDLKPTESVDFSANDLKVEESVDSNNFNSEETKNSLLSRQETISIEELPS